MQFKMTISCLASGSANMPPPLRSTPSLPASLRLQQTILKYLIKSSDPFLQELLGQTLGAITYPLLRRSLTRHTPTLPALEQFLRPVLVPEEHAKGIECWYNNSRFQTFLRKEYLQRVATAEAVAGGAIGGGKEEKQNAVGQEGTKEAAAVADAAPLPPSTPPSLPPWATDVITDKDGLKTTRIPTHEELVAFFHLHDWNRRPGPRSAALEGAKRQSLFHKLKEEGPDVSTWSLNDILEVGGACVEGRGRFNVFCEEAGLWEVWTNEYVDTLAAYLTKRARALSSLPPSPSSPPPPIIVLEVGAGTGTLAYHLKQRLDPSLITYIATDIEPTPPPLPPSSPPSLLPSLLAHPFVEELSWEKALNRYPDAAIVICAWMPTGENWTEGIRKGGREGGRGVQEYIMIGEHGEQAACGDPVKTWGADNPPNTLKPWETDGFIAQEEEALGQWQWSRYDGKAFARNSATVCFRRGGRGGREGGRGGGGRTRK